MKIGLDFDSEQIFLELSSDNGTRTTATMSAQAALALADQLIANAEALALSLEQGNLGNKDAITNK